MKHLYTLVFILLATWAGNAKTDLPSTDKSWYNTEQSTFTLTTAAQLAGLAELVDDGHAFKDTTFILGNDIDLTSWLDNYIEGWEPIGYYEYMEKKPFQGIFEGNNKQISGLWLKSATNFGLFALVGDQGQINNLTVVIDNRSGKEGLQCSPIWTGGGLVAINAGCITNCHVLQAEDSNNPAISNKGTTGGLVGINVGIISQCHAAVTIYVKMDEVYFGGLAGKNYSDENGDYSDGDITATIQYSYATGKLINASYWNESGGLVGTNSALITDCYARVEVSNQHTTTNNVWSGGLAGSNNGEISNCYATGAVTNANPGDEDVFIGGLIGYSYIANKSYNDTETVTASFFDNETSGQTLGIGDDDTSNSIGRSTLEMTTRTTFDQWDFDTIWGIDSSINDGYPHFLWEYPASEPEPQAATHIVTLTADPGINLLPSAGIHSAIEGKSFYFYVTLAPGFEGRTPQASINGKPVDLILRPNGTEWMYVIPGVDTDMLVALTFNTTANDNADAPRLYSRDSQLFVETPVPLTLTVYSVTGQTVASRRLSEGLTTIPLPTGIYIVRMDERVEKVTVRGE